MIIFNIGCGILIFSNFIISILPNKDAVKSSNNPKLVNKFLMQVIICMMSLGLAVILGIIGAYVYLIPLLSSNSDEWLPLLSPGVFITLCGIAFIRIHFKLIKKDDK